MSNARIGALACLVLAVLVLAAGPAGTPGTLFLLACAAYRWSETPPAAAVRVRPGRRRGAH